MKFTDDFGMFLVEDEEEEVEEDSEELAFSTSEKNAPLVREN